MGDTARLSDSQLDGNLLKLQTVNDRLDAIESDREKARIEALIQERLPSFPRGPVPVAEVQPEQHTAQESSTPGLYPELSPLDDDQTLYEEENPYKSHKVLIEDWSDTGRGSHVDFAKDETISLQQGKLNPESRGNLLMQRVQVAGLVEVSLETCMRLLSMAGRSRTNSLSSIASVWTECSEKSIS